jgi:hypothetical protein
VRYLRTGEGVDERYLGSLNSGPGGGQNLEKNGVRIQTTHKVDRAEVRGMRRNPLGGPS